MMAPWLQKAMRRTRLASKSVYQSIVPAPARPTSLLFVVGCQRSGTTLLTRILEKDWRSNVFGELGELFDNVPRQHRLKPLAQVEAQLQRRRGSFQIIKPLVESQRIIELLRHFQHSKAVWLFRHYEDVAASNLKRFGHNNGIRNLEPIVERDNADWRAQGLSQATVELVREHFAGGMPPHDAAALFWYVRNQLFFDQGLGQLEAVRTCSYHSLVTNPAQTVRSLYNFIDITYPGDQILTEVHVRSLGKGKSIQLSAPIQTLCAEMWQRLDTVNQQRDISHISS